VIVVIPVTLLMPSPIVLVPPAVMLIPASFARFLQFTQFVLCLLAVASVALDSFVEFVFGVLDVFLALRIRFGMHAGYRERHYQSASHYRRQQPRLDFPY
jgi:hypothetical protein